MEKRATQILEEEHHLIQQVVGAMAALADRVFEGQVAEKETLVNFVDFMQVFVEKCHHEKEENHLFPLLVKKGVPVAGCPIGVLTHEHQTAGKLTTDLGAAVEAYLKDPSGMGHFLVTTLRGVVALYPGHIWRENYLLFPMTDKILDDREQEGLVEQFGAVERKIGLDVHQRFEQLAEKAG
ncbi:hemerythrin domain-containing protein [Geobacter grbiciae]|uniref:hemerythrin domain-containing protein n=1 Tax=Geobacter grbiciae TaxID=155042 RepID=UPI001C00CB9A|nr:hemerythrin domain-containing protein [Geobacter grbiciae]MBT1074417.1 hemerythrin domain-containing protein [Geobacter grbiciae]